MLLRPPVLTCPSHNTFYMGQVATAGLNWSHVLPVGKVTTGIPRFKWMWTTYFRTWQAGSSHMALFRTKRKKHPFYLSFYHPVEGTACWRHSLFHVLTGCQCYAWHTKWSALKNCIYNPTRRGIPGGASEGFEMDEVRRQGGLQDHRLLGWSLFLIGMQFLLGSIPLRN